MTDCFYQSNIIYLEKYVTPLIKEEIENYTTIDEKINEFFITFEITPFNTLDLIIFSVFKKIYGVIKLTFGESPNKDKKLATLIDKVNDFYSEKIHELKDFQKEKESTIGPIKILKIKIKIKSLGLSLKLDIDSTETKFILKSKTKIKHIEE